MEIVIHSMHKHGELQEMVEEMEKRRGRRGLYVFAYRRKGMVVCAFSCKHSPVWGGGAHANG